MRLRQVVLAAADLEPVVARLREALPLGVPYADPGVALFGLRNAVLALGDTFVEVVAPAQDGTAVGRQLARRGGDCGYMVLLETADLAGAQARAAALGIRTAWEVQLDDIAAVHLHPADTGGALLSLDQPAPPGSWRWAGPGWSAGGGGGVVAATLAVPEPDAVAQRWGALLDRPVRDTAVALDGGGELRFVRGEAGLCAVDVAAGSAVTAAGVRFVPVG